MSSASKKCKKCLNELPLSEFKPHPETKDRLQTWCDSCRKAYALSYYKKNKQEQNERRRNYYDEHKKSETN